VKKTLRGRRSGRTSNPSTVNSWMRSSPASSTKRIRRVGCSLGARLAQLYDVNPLTAAKAYRELQRDGFVEALRGEGLIVRNGMRVGLLKRERAKFMKEEWPALRARLARLEVDLKALLATASD